MNLRLSDVEMARLRAQAEREHRSLNEVARLAVLSRIEDGDRRERVLALTDQVMTEHAHTLQRLKDLQTRRGDVPPRLSHIACAG